MIIEGNFAKPTPYNADIISHDYTMTHIDVTAHSAVQAFHKVFIESQLNARLWSEADNIKYIVVYEGTLRDRDLNPNHLILFESSDDCAPGREVRNR